MTQTTRMRLSPGAWIVPAALLLPLVLVVVLLAQGRRAEEARQALVRRAIDDYSGIAAWQFAQFAAQTIRTTSNQIVPCDCAMGMGGAMHERLTGVALGTFSFDVATQQATFDGPMFDAATRARLLRDMEAAFRSNAREPHRAVFDTIGGQMRAIVMNLAHRMGGVVTAVNGAITDTAIFKDRLDSMIARRSLLPSALVESPLRREQVQVRLATTDGRYLFTVGSSSGNDVSATDTLSRESGALRATLALDPSVGSLLLLPRSEYPLSTLVGLSVLAAFLAIAALVQFRRSRELARLRGQFVANVSHELRTPLTHISMFAETLMLERERSPDERRHFAAVMHREARRLMNLVDGVMRFARVDAGRDMLQLTPLDASAEIAETLETFRPMLDAAACRLETELPPRAVVIADAPALRQVATNLLDNAVKYGPHGQTVRVTLALTEDAAMLVVADEGPGIRPEDRERVFEPFTRLADERAPRVAGAGIGLSLVKDLVERMGGTIGVADRNGGGAAVWVRLRRSNEAVSLPVDGKAATLLTRV